MRLNLLLLLSFAFTFTACSLEEGNREQMVSLQHVKNDPETQLANLNTAISQAGTDGSLYARRAAVLLRKGDLRQALQDADEAVKLTKSDPYSLYVKAQILRRMGKLDEALPLALQAERNSYQSSSIYSLLGEIYLQRKAYRQAWEYLSKAQELAPGNQFVFYSKGRVAEATGDTVTAESNYSLAIKQAPAYMEPKRELSGLLLAQAKFAAAKPLVYSALRQAPEDGLLWYYKGLVHQAELKKDSAMLAFHQAISMADTLQGAHFQLGMQQYALGENELALEHLQKATVYKNQPVYVRAVASAYERTGQYMSALAAYQRLAQLEPNNTFVYQSIGRLKNKIKKPMPAGPAVPQAQTEQ